MNNWSRSMPLKKLPREPSPPLLRAKRQPKKAEPIDRFGDFAKDLRTAVDRMLPENGKIYNRAAILAIDFSDNDIPRIKPLRDELLRLLQTVYNWSVETYTIDCQESYRNASFWLRDAKLDFAHKHASWGGERCLLVYYFSGHGFSNEHNALNLCGSVFRHKDGTWDPMGLWLPCVTPELIPVAPASLFHNHQLVIMDCCDASLANIEDPEIEVLGASAWESTAGAQPQVNFTRALVDALKEANGESITTTQLISKLYSRETVTKGVSMPFHKQRTSRLEPALIHKIGRMSKPLPQIKTVPKQSYVEIAIRIRREESAPSAIEWARWLSKNLPLYTRHIEILASWKQPGSCTVVIVLPIEIWLDLPAREGYIFIDYHRRK